MGRWVQGKPQAAILLRSWTNAEWWQGCKYSKEFSRVLPMMITSGKGQSGTSFFCWWCGFVHQLCIFIQPVSSRGQTSYTEMWLWALHKGRETTPTTPLTTRNLLTWCPISTHKAQKHVATWWTTHGHECAAIGPNSIFHCYHRDGLRKADSDQCVLMYLFKTMRNRTQNQWTTSSLRHDHAYSIDRSSPTQKKTKQLAGEAASGQNIDV